MMGSPASAAPCTNTGLVVSQTNAIGAVPLDLRFSKAQPVATPPFVFLKISTLPEML
ncbi:Uncharacterised protein [Bordetella pertussis]|nr:Uncharacterised protein [Bordetella pertussis]CFO65178.1 Uncharacterised protein [Bordetella pertussis]CPH66657.1 Uncharacterised protein [Bordetella pertussis]CPK48749.1 Uncharacterised protein [Bordetella pertussis]CPL52336.1 Uncharacterised protein [Bordetella pertussis]